MKNSSISINKSRHKRDPKKSKLVRTIFEIEDVKTLDPPKNKNVIKINYDKNIYFGKPNQEKEIANIISNVINPNSSKNINSNNIQLNVNINNNYYGPYNNNYSKTMDIEKNNYMNKKSNSSINSKNTFNKTMDSTINNSLNTTDNLNNENKKRNIYKEKASYALLEFKSIQSNKLNNFRTSTKKNVLKSNDNFSKTMKNIRKTEKLSTEPSNSSLEKVKIIPKVEKKDSDDLLKYIPCMNCGNLISFDDIEKHSLTCTKVSDEIMKNDISKLEINSIDYKLKKLQEHLLSMLNGINNYENNKNDIEIKFLCTILSEYIKEVLELKIIDIPSIKEFKKVLKNLENISIKYKDHISDLILIDRTKNLVNEKLKIFKNSYKKDFDTKKRNLSKTGTLKYEEDLKLKIKQLEKLNAETELEKTKVKNLRKSAGPANRPKYIKNLSNSIISEKKDESIISDCKDNNNNYNNLNTIKVDEIISDVENNTSNLFSVNTSMSNLSSFNNNDGSYIGDKFLKGNVNLENLKKNDNNENDFQINYNRNINNNNNYNSNNNNILNTSDNSNDEYEKREKKKFFNEVLKIKFEKLHSTHKGQLINQKYIWEECKKQNIPKKNWSEFILGELNNPYKYLEIQKREKRNKSRKAPMAVITEENN